jgi:hypothetical protein
MATTCSSATDGGVDHGGSSSNERQSMRPTFGMKKGVVQRAGHILWKGKYIDQNEFYKVGPDFYTPAHSRFGHYFCSNLYGRAPRGPRGVKKSFFFFYK